MSGSEKNGIESKSSKPEDGQLPSHHKKRRGENARLLLSIPINNRNTAIAKLFKTAQCRTKYYLPESCKSACALIATYLLTEPRYRLRRTNATKAHGGVLTFSS